MVKCKLIVICVVKTLVNATTLLRTYAVVKRFLIHPSLAGWGLVLGLMILDQSAAGDLAAAAAMVGRLLSRNSDDSSQKFLEIDVNQKKEQLSAQRCAISRYIVS